MDHPTAASASASAAAGNRAEADRLLSIAEKLLETRDLTGSREFAVLAQETEPLLEGPDQILAICDVLLAGDKRIDTAGSGIKDWYGILQVERRSNDFDLMKRNYRRLALLLHPDKNKYPHANSAFRLVADAWTVVSDQSKKSAYDAELNHFCRVELAPKASQNQSQNDKLPVRRSSRGGGGGVWTPNDRVRSHSDGGSRSSNFWTACPYCYVLYQYPRVYKDCCLRCQSCQRAFHAAVVPSLPPIVPGKEAYYCCWGFFPLGFSVADDGDKKGNSNSGAFPNWKPPMFSGGSAGNSVKATAAAAAPASAAEDRQRSRETVVGVSGGSCSAGIPQAAMGLGAGTGTAPKKRGRPRKNPL